MDVLNRLDNLIQDVRAWPHRNALLVIDMQNDFLDPGGSMGLRGTDLSMAQACIDPIQQLCLAARAHQVPIIWVLAGYSGKRLPPISFPLGTSDGIVHLEEKLFGTHTGKTSICVPGTWGAGLYSGFEVQPEDLVVHKSYFSAFSDTCLNELLQARQISHLVMCGVTTANCVRATATDARLRGYQVTIPQNTTASWTVTQHSTAWKRLKCFVDAPENFKSVFLSQKIPFSNLHFTSSSLLSTPSNSCSSSPPNSLPAVASADTITQHVDVAIIGAGIGGLALALHLQSQNPNLHVAVFERDASFDARAQGYSLTIQGGLKVLEHLTIAKAVSKGATKGGSGQVIMRSNGECIVALGGGGKSSRNVFIPRQRLRGVMFEQLQTGCVRWGKALVGLHEEASGVLLRFSDNSRVCSQIVVGADGVNSVVRGFKLGDELHYLGVLSLNGIASFRHPLCPNGNLQVLGEGTRLFAKPFSNGRTMWQLTVLCDRVKAEEYCRQADILSLALHFTDGWHPSFISLLQASESSQLRAGLLFDRDPHLCARHPTEFSRVVLLGDAAHPMSPFKGQGANQALLDTMALSTILASLFKSSSCSSSRNNNSNSEDVCLGGNRTNNASDSSTGNTNRRNREKSGIESYDGEKERKTWNQGAKPMLSQELVFELLAEYHKQMAMRVTKAVLGSRKNVVFYHSTPLTTDVELKFGVADWTTKRQNEFQRQKEKLQNHLAIT